MLRKIGKGFLVLLLLLAGWIAINSIDEAPRYDTSLLLPPVNVPDEQNGYALLRSLGDGDGKSLLLSEDDSKRLYEVVIDGKWDRQFAERVLSEHSNAIELAKQVVEKPRFAINYSMENIYSNIPSFFTNMKNIILLRAKLDKENGNYSDAIKSADLAIRYCEKIRMDEQRHMISYLVGLICIANVTDFYHELLSNNSLSDDQLIKIEQSIGSVAEYGNDNFYDVLRREFSDIKRITQWYDRQNVTERLRIVRDAIRENRLCYTCKYSLLDIAYGYFNAVFARYYLHANEVLNVQGYAIKKAIPYAENRCGALEKSWKIEGFDGSWGDSKTLLDFLVPGSAAAKANFSWSYESYVLRRCDYYNYLSAMKGIVAIARYRVANDGEYPTSLQKLIPDYVKELPEDYFGRSSLNYDRASRRLYSVGIEHENTAPSNAGLNKGRCIHSSVAPLAACEFSPTFPVDWDEYKFYETLNKAESGDACSQNMLGWMYQFGRYTEVNEDKAIYWYGKAAEKNCTESMWRIGSIYENRQSQHYDPKLALEWLKKSYDKGSSYGAAKYAEHLIDGDLGVVDFKQAAKIYNHFSSNREGSYYQSWLYFLKEKYHRGLFADDVIVAAWADYYLQQADIAKKFDGEMILGEINSGNKLLHQLMIGYLWNNAWRYNASTKEEKIKMDKWAGELRDHYLGADDENGAKKLDEFVASRVKSASEKIPETPDLCKLLFDHRHEDMQKFLSVQQEIFRHRKKANNLVASYNREMEAKYRDSGMLNHDGNGRVSLGFPSIEFKSVMALLFDISDLDSRDSALQFDIPAGRDSVMLHAENLLPAPTANVLLASLGLGADCSGEKIRFFVEDTAMLKPKMLGDFIVDWSGVSLKNGNLEGDGKLVFAGGTQYEGQVSAGLPNGKGKYLFSESVFYGDNFVDGMLNGNGHRSVNGHDEERGEYRDNLLNGQGAIGYGSQGLVYEGSFVDTAFHGEGKVTYFDVGDLQTYFMPIDNNYSPIWSFTGQFKDNQKTTGTCSIYRERKIVDTFSCEFYEDNLVKIGEVSLLPPGMTSTDGLQKYHP